MTPQRPLRRLVALTLVLTVLVSCLGGCRKPSEEARQNRRLVDGLLTALTTGNQKQLEKCKVMLDERHADGLLSESNHKLLSEVFDQARSGKGGGAEESLYEFRKSHPFPR